jgi:hypothetical protein
MVTGGITHLHTTTYNIEERNRTKIVRNVYFQNFPDPDVFFLAINGVKIKLSHKIPAGISFVQHYFTRKTTMNDTHKELIRQLKSLLLKGHAHATLEDALNNIPENLRSVVPDKLPYSIWQLAEHIRITQWDILEFSRDPKHVSPQWPNDYWPTEPGPQDATGWDDCIQQIIDDRNAFIAMLEKKDVDLYTPFSWGDGQNLLREAMLIADHNSYHTAEIIVVRRLLGDW